MKEFRFWLWYWAAFLIGWAGLTHKSFLFFKHGYAAAREYKTLDYQARLKIEPVPGRHNLRPRPIPVRGP